MSTDAQGGAAPASAVGPSGPPRTPAPVAAAATEAAPDRAAGQAPVGTPPGLRWAGEPTLESHGRRFYAAFDAGSRRYSLGDAVYLRHAEPGAPPFLAHLESLHEQLPASGDDDAAGQAAAPPGSMWAGVRWFYRPSELEVAGPFKAEDHEVFWADEYAVHPLEAVCGKCTVLTPAQADRQPGSTAAHPGGVGVFVCSRKYLPGERRVVPLDDGVEGPTLAAALQEKPFEEVEGRIKQREPTAADRAAAQPRPKRVRGASHLGPAAAVEPLGSPAAGKTREAAEPQEEEPPAPDLAEPSTLDPRQPPAKRRRHEREHLQERSKQ